MLAPEFTERHLAPVDPAEQVSPEMAQAALDFYRRLFSRERADSGYVDNLDGIVATDFQEDNHPEAVHEDGHVAARGLAGLRAYRANFDDPDGNPPELVSLETIAVPTSETWNIPGTNERYDFGAVLQFTVRGPRGRTFGVRLREDLKFGRDDGTGQLQVVRRMYRGIGEGDQGYLGADTESKNHHELVGQQIGHIMATGESAPLAPLLQAYQGIFPGVEVS